MAGGQYDFSTPLNPKIKAIAPPFRRRYTCHFRSPIIAGSRAKAARDSLCRAPVNPNKEFAAQGEVGLYLGVAGLGLLDQAAHSRLIEDLTDRHRPHGPDDLVAARPAPLDLRLVARWRFPAHRPALSPGR